MKQHLQSPGVFETIRYKDGRIEYFHEHLERLRQGLRQLDMNTELSDIESVIFKRLEEQHLLSKTCRVWMGVTEHDVAITVEEYHPLSRSLYQKGILLTLAEHPEPTKKAQIKYFHRQGYNELYSQAEKEGAQECLCLHHGYILECSRSNIIVKLDGRYIVPPSNGFRLVGIMEQAVCQKLGEVTEENIHWPLPPEALLYITGSLKGILPVAKVNSHHFRIDSNDQLFKLIPQFWPY